MIKSGLAAAALTVLSFALGFARDIGLAHAFGGSLQADIIFIALLIPMLIENVLGIVLRDALVPYMHSASSFNALIAKSEAARLGRPLLISTLALSLLLIAIPDAALSVIAPGWTPEEIQRAIPSFQIGAATLSVTIWAYFLNAAMYVRNEFVLPLWRTVMMNLGALTAIFVFQAPPHLILAGILFGLCVHLVWMQFRLGAYGLLPWKGERYLPQTRLKTLFLPLFGATLAMQVSVFAERFFASMLEPGTIAQLSYAYRLVTIPLTIFTLAVLSIILSRLSKLHQKSYEDWRQEVNIAFSCVVAFFMPVSAIFIGLSYPLVEIFFVRGAFTTEDAIKTSEMIAAYSLGLPALAAVLLFNRVILTTGKTASLYWGGVGAVIITLSLDYLLLPFFGGMGLALALSAGATMNAVILGYALRQHLYIRDLFFRSLTWIAACLALVAFFWAWPLTGSFALLCGSIIGGAFFLGGVAVDGRLRKLFLMMVRNI